MIIAEGLGIRGLFRLLLVTCGFWISFTVQLSAQQTACSAATYPNASRAISTWEDSRQVRLDGEARKAVISDFCTGARKVSNETGLAEPQIDATADMVVPSYLEEIISGKDKIPPISYLISRQFAVGSEPGFPSPVRLGVIVFTYEKTIERLRVGRIYAEPIPNRLMTNIGVVEIAGLVGNQTVCQGTVSVRPGVSAAFKC